MNRRTLLKDLTVLSATTLFAPVVQAQADGLRFDGTHQPLRKIATEEAFNIPEIAEAIKTLVRKGGNQLDLAVLKQIYDPPASNNEVATASVSNRDAATKSMLPKLLDIDALRLADMDANGVDMQLLSITLPGVQMFEKTRAVELARVVNDHLSQAVRKNPSRFAGLACFAPLDVAASVKEMKRSIKNLGLNGFILNSHTNNEYLDNEKFWPLLEAAEALQAPLYLHPRAPSDGMAEPFREYRLEGAVWGYGVETATHILRMIFGGVFDRFPNL
jgi:5-carboxyvanillate decarboxylase